VTANGAAASRVYDDLRARIVRWEIAPGETLREAEIATELDVSRTPVREALQQLRSEGLVAAKGRRGSEVPIWTRQELDDSYRVRATLEARAARLATERRSNLDLPRLHDLANEMTERWQGPQPDLVRIAELNIEFHQLISTGAGSMRLVQMLSRVVHMPLLYKVFETFTPAQVTMTLLEHHTILMAIEAGDAEWAEAITKAHILAALSSLMGADEIFGTHSSLEARHRSPAGAWPQPGLGQGRGIAERSGTQREEGPRGSRALPDLDRNAPSQRPVP